MRVILLSMAIMIGLVTLGVPGSGQSVERTRVTVQFKNITLKQALVNLENATNFSFTYRNADVENTSLVNYEVSNATLSKVLKDILKDAHLVFIQRANNIILKKDETMSIAEEGLALVMLTPTSDTVPSSLVTIKGRVISSERGGEPVPNASVFVRQSNYGTSTDADGYFVIRIPDMVRVLSVSQVNFEPFDMRIDSRSMMIITLKPRSQTLSAVVTTGLFKRPKENFTGSATTITGDQLRSVSMVNALQAIRMFDPAIRIPDNVQFGSDPNRLPIINLRGTNNFPQQTTGTTQALPSGADFMANYATNPNQPLFILDGFEVSLQKIYDLDINRIASFTILKDAAATSLYGSRAANGVIVVDTKQPAPGKLQASYSGTLRITAPDLTVYHLLNAEQKLEAERIGGLYNRYSTGAAPDQDAYNRRLYSSRMANARSGVNTYWLSKPLQTGYGQQHSLSLSGGDQYIRYGLNLNYLNNVGVMKNSNRDNYGIDMNLQYRYRGLIFRNSLSITVNKANNSNYGSFSEYSRLNQYWKPYDANGNVAKVLEDFEGSGNFIVTNPLYNATINTVSNLEYTNLVNQSDIEWNIGRGFRITGSLGFNRQIDENNRFLPASHTSFINERDFTKRGNYTKGYAKFMSTTARLKLDYSKKAGYHQVFNTTQAEIGQTTSDATSVFVEGFPNERLNEISFGNSYPANSKPSGNANVTRRVSVLNSFSYNYDSRYLLDASIRADGSSQFGSAKRFAPFWSAGLGWNIYKEKFIRNINWIDQLRVRASVGTTGDDRFAPYMAITTYKYYTDMNFHGLVGSSLMGYGNDGLQWQQTLKKNIGIEFTGFKNRLTLRFDLYQENTSNLILDINTPPSAGVTSYKENIGKLANKGFEFTLNYFAIKNDKRSIYWSVFANGLRNKSYIRSISNSLKKLNENNDKNDKNQQTKPQSRFQEGYSPNAIWAVRSAGIDPSTGRELYYKKDGSLTYNWDPQDKVIVGDPTGAVIGSFGTNFSYKDFMLALYFNYQYDAQVYNQTLADRVENVDLRWQADERVLLGRWKNSGDITFFKGLTTENGVTVVTPTYATSRFLQTDNYIHFSSISFSYQLPERISRKIRLNNTRIGIIANDITRWSGMEVERGLDYPFARSFTVNLSTSF